MMEHFTTTERSEFPIHRTKWMTVIDILLGRRQDGSTTAETAEARVNTDYLQLYPQSLVACVPPSPDSLGKSHFHHEIHFTPSLDSFLLPYEESGLQVALLIMRFVMRKYVKGGKL